MPLPAPAGAEMMGYALRSGVASGLLDALYARALHLRGHEDVLLVALDLCLLAVPQAAEVRARLAARTGLPPERIVVTCIHTHAGPDTGLGALLAGAAPPAHVAALLDGAVEAGLRAVAASAPARIGFATAPVAIGRNRRSAGGPVDPVARVLRVDRADGTPLAVVWLHGCHPTALGHENLRYSADWPGAAHAAVETALPGALSIFVLSAHADIDPRTRGLQDLALPNRSLGVDAEAMRSLGREAGESVARAAAAVTTCVDDRIAAASARVEVAVHGGAEPEPAAAALSARRRDALRALGLPEGAPVRVRDLHRLAEERMASLPPEEAREVASRVRLYLRDRSAPAFAGGRLPRLEVQALRVGEARWLALPLEPTIRVGQAFASGPGREQASLLSIGNGWLRYLPHALDFEEPPAAQGYEVLSSTFVPRGAEILLERGRQLECDIDFHFRTA